MNGEEIVKLYTEEDKTLLEISDYFNCHYSTVRRVLVDLKVKIRTKSETKILQDKISVHRTHELNEDYFKTWTKEMAYILGVIYSDGNIIDSSYLSSNGRKKHRSVLGIVLHESDRELLEKIKKEMNYSGDIHTYVSKVSGIPTGSNHCSLKMHSAELIKDLKKIGLEERKSLTKELPDIPEEYAIEFFRGYFDGNGSVGGQYPTNSNDKKTKTCQIRVRIFSGSKKFIEKLQEIVVRNGFKKKRIYKNETDTAFEICYSTNESLALFDLMYKREECMYLNRKHEDFKSLIKQRKEDIETHLKN